MISHFCNSENLSEETIIKINIFDDRKKIVSKTIRSISPNAINLNLTNLIEKKLPKKLIIKNLIFYWFTVNSTLLV